MKRPRAIAVIMTTATAIITACSSGGRSAPAQPDSLAFGPTYVMNLDSSNGRPNHDLFGDVYTGRGTSGGQLREDNVRTSDGVLTISAHGQDLGGACLCGADAPKTIYGVYEFSFRTSAGQGYVPVVLLWPEDRDDLGKVRLWREGGELDILEVENPDRSEASTTLHWFAPWGSPNEHRAQANVTADFTSFRRVRVLFLPDQLRVHVDGREVFQETNPARIPPQVMHLTAQIDVHWDKRLQPSEESQLRGTELQMSGISYRPVNGVSRNPDGSMYASPAAADSIITLG